jgi:hypothetical protein
LLDQPVAPLIKVQIELREGLLEQPV